jgi:conjugal transfer pilus assembly protein TraW
MKRILLLFMSVLSTLNGKDFGAVGQTVPIKENDIIEVIKDRADCISDDQKDKLQAKIRSHYEKKLKNPKPVPIPETVTYYAHSFDPTVTIGYDIKDHEGNVIVRKGTIYNPLMVQKLNKNLLIFNGEDKEQIEWAKSQDGIWVLVKGRPLDLEESEKIPVFFDQGGVLCHKFGVKSVPTKISQHEFLLKVESMPKWYRP